MKGDFTRGHGPDSKRGMRYRRALLQQGRLLLDSDFNATVDALVEGTRLGLRDLGCLAGGPELGYLVTPGRLLGVFPTDAGVVAPATAVAWIDFRYKVLDRLPALYLEATDASATFSLPLRQPFDPAISQSIAVWLLTESETAFTIQVNGKNVTVGPDDDTPVFVRKEVGTFGAGFDTLTITLAAGRSVWVGLVEQDQAAGDLPSFWVADGSYHVDGLVVENPGDQRFPGVSFPQDSDLWTSGSPPPALIEQALDGTVLGDDVAELGNPSTGARLLVYLEVWERHITRLDDPGLREEALGGALDTCTRSRLLGQVKVALAEVSNDVPTAKDEIQAAFETITRDQGVIPSGGGRLSINARTIEPDPDPCALPELTGYTGTDNRLYRFEVFEAGDYTTASITWSRDNGSELYAATVSSGALTVAPDAPLSSGDLVEILSDATDLGDEVRGHLTGAAFTPPQRCRGVLVELGSPHTSVAGQFTIKDWKGAAGVTLGDRLTTMPVRVRRWHGVISPAQIGLSANPVTPPSAGPHAVEDGLEIRFSTTGAFAPGEWWAYEARVEAENANAPVVDALPHGPERRFAPLALMDHQGAGEPLLLLAWLDHRFHRLCELVADDIAYDGERVGSGADTVQEALDELFEREVTGGCCDITLEPSGEDDGAIIAALLEEYAGLGSLTICLKPGRYDLGTPLRIAKMRLTIAGCPEAVLVDRDISGAPFFVLAGGELTLRDLTLVGLSDDGEALVRVASSDEDTAIGLRAERVAFVCRYRDASAPVVLVESEYSDSTAPQKLHDALHRQRRPEEFSDAISKLKERDPSPPSVELRECSIFGGWGVMAGAPLASLTLVQTYIWGTSGGLLLDTCLSLVLDQVLIETGYDRDPLLRLTAVSFDDAATQIAALTTAASSRDGVGLAAGLVASGSVTRLAASGALAVDMSYVESLRFRDCTLSSPGVGLALAHAQGVQIQGCTILGELDERLLSKRGPTGVTLSRYARSVTITQCIVRGAAFGILIGDDLGENESRSDTLVFEQVLVTENQVEVRTAGISIGCTDATAEDSAYRNVEVSGNQIMALARLSAGPPTAAPLIADSRGILVRPSWTSSEDEDDAVPATIRVVGNAIYNMAQGIYALGPHSDILDNRILVDVGDGKAYYVHGIELRFGHDVRIEGNLVDVRLEKAQDSISISLFQCYNVRVVRNTVRSTEPVPPLDIDQFKTGIQVSENDLRGGGTSQISKGSRIVFRANRLEGDVLFDRVTDGVVCDNVVNLDLDASTRSILVLSAGGRWQINDNRASGAIRILPAVYGSDSDERRSVRMALMARDEDRTPKGRRDSNDVETVDHGESDGRFSLDFTNIELIPTAIYDYAHKFQGELIKEFLKPDKKVDDLKPDYEILAGAEVAIHAQIEDNQCRELQVGYIIAELLDKAKDRTISTDYLYVSVPDKQTVVQVAGNHVDGLLLVHRYNYALVTDNLLQDLISGIIASSTAIVVHNVQLP